MLTRDPIDILEDAIWEVSYGIGSMEGNCCLVHDHPEYRGFKICPESKDSVDLIFELRDLQKLFKAITKANLRLLSHYVLSALESEQDN